MAIALRFVLTSALRANNNATTIDSVIIDIVLMKIFIHQVRSGSKKREKGQT